MSTENLKEKIDYLPPDSIVSIEISGAFSNRLQFLMFNELRQYTQEDSTAILKRIENNEPSLSPEEDVLHAFAAIIAGIIHAAKQSGKMLQKEPELAVKEIEELMEKMPEYQPRGSKPTEG